jgi:hypothetical protein
VPQQFHCRIDEQLSLVLSQPKHNLTQRLTSFSTQLDKCILSQLDNCRLGKLLVRKHSEERLKESYAGLNVDFVEAAGLGAIECSAPLNCSDYILGVFLYAPYCVSYRSNKIFSRWKEISTDGFNGLSPCIPLWSTHDALSSMENVT